jgi:ligand-binding sensor domain-containing protein
LQNLKCNLHILFSCTTCPFLSGLILALVILSNPVVAQSGSVNNNPEYIISKRLLSIEDGLASHEVFCGVQDKTGFMWFGTRNGLNRYDGKNCLLFTRQRNNLQDNKVVQLAKDDVNNLFIEWQYRFSTNY